MTDRLEAGREHHEWAINTYRLRETIVRNHLMPYIGAPPMLTIEQIQRLMSETEPLWLETIIIVATMTAFQEGELFARHWGNVVSGGRDFGEWS